MLNLYSRVALQKPKAGDLKNIDKENLAYITKTLSGADEKARIIIGWGNSLQSNKTTNQSKLALLESLSAMKAGKRLWQVTADEMSLELAGTHILYLGLRYADCVWTLTEYPIKAEMDRITKILLKNAGREKQGKEKKAAEKKETENQEDKGNVSENSEQDGH